MKKKIIFAIGILSILSAIIGYNYSHSSKKEVVTLNLNYVGLQDTYNKVSDISEFIVYGEIKDFYVEDFKGVPFTYYNVKVLDTNEKKKLKKDNIKVRVTGGIKGNIIYKSEEQELFDKNDRYMFFLKRTFPNKPTSNVYTIVGEYQGVFKVDNETIGKFNTKNDIEKNVIDKDLDFFLKNN